MSQLVSISLPFVGPTCPTTLFSLSLCIITSDPLSLESPRQQHKASVTNHGQPLQPSSHAHTSPTGFRRKWSRETCGGKKFESDNFHQARERTAARKSRVQNHQFLSRDLNIGEQIQLRSKRSTSLDWARHHDIILGIARGVLYLHQDSRLRIVHRDFKAINGGHEIIKNENTEAFTPLCICRKRGRIGGQALGQGGPVIVSEQGHFSWPGSGKRSRLVGGFGGDRRRKRFRLSRQRDRALSMWFFASLPYAAHIAPASLIKSAHKGEDLKTRKLNSRKQIKAFKDSKQNTTVLFMTMGTEPSMSGLGKEKIDDYL
ncbi:hypothetical protein Syun_016889 [Stephania yunnanensis]|uniref:Uncharacterized protein n=1 Tax=Stephania yunnanensis TaxID=152371 RepID=A0AAP0P1W1_9MAGN